MSKLIKFHDHHGQLKLSNSYFLVFMHYVDRTTMMLRCSYLLVLLTFTHKIARAISDLLATSAKFTLQFQMDLTGEKQLSDEDSVQRLVEYSNEHDAVLAFYYTDENNKVINKTSYSLVRPFCRFKFAKYSTPKTHARIQGKERSELTLHECVLVERLSLLKKTARAVAASNKTSPKQQRIRVYHWLKTIADIMEQRKSVVF